MNKASTLSPEWDGPSGGVEENLSYSRGLDNSWRSFLHSPTSRVKMRCVHINDLQCWTREMTCSLICILLSVEEPLRWFHNRAIGTHTTDFLPLLITLGQFLCTCIFTLKLIYCIRSFILATRPRKWHAYNFIQRCFLNKLFSQLCVLNKSTRICKKGNILFKVQTITGKTIDLQIDPRPVPTPPPPDKNVLPNMGWEEIHNKSVILWIQKYFLCHKYVQLLFGSPGEWKWAKM